MEYQAQDRATFIRFVDKYDQLLMQRQVPSDRNFHLQHPDLTPDGAVAFRYYEHTTEVVDGVTYHNECNHSDWTPVPKYAHAS